MKEYNGLEYEYDFTVLKGVCDEKHIKNEYILHEDTKQIGKNAFWHVQVQNIKFNKGLEYIGPKAFGACDLQNIEILKPVELGDACFLNNPSLKKVLLNASTIPSRCFSHSNIDDLRIPLTKEIGFQVFERCVIGKLNFKGVEVIAAQAFNGATFGFSTLTLPSTIQEIRQYAFKGTSLKEIYLPDSITVLSPEFTDKGKVIHASAKLIERFPFLNDFPFLKISGMAIDDLFNANKSFKEINKAYKEGSIKDPNPFDVEK